MMRNLVPQLREQVFSVYACAVLKFSILPLLEKAKLVVWQIAFYCKITTCILIYVLSQSFRSFVHSTLPQFTQLCK